MKRERKYDYRAWCCVCRRFYSRWCSHREAWLETLAHNYHRPEHFVYLERRPHVEGTP